MGGGVGGEREDGKRLWADEVEGCLPGGELFNSEDRVSHK